MANTDETTIKRDIINLDIRRKEAVNYLNNNPNATFKTIFEFIPKTTFATASGLNPMRMSPRADDPALFRVGDLLSIAEFLKIPPERAFKLAMASMPKKQKF
jgi:hypothetical protein